ncbi:hypothetical protein [Algoriphagus marincola]|uniref:hypothetical protein n=1 Tax=Algoriphagus marincola TaxID=264027 RepID=UPI000479C359|nr:hypothetical protein [Algoriphagus marincola]
MKQLGPKKIKAIILLVAVVIIHLLLDLYYRPMAYSKNINDFGLKDSFTQISSVIGISLLMVLFEKENFTKGKSGRVFLTLVPVVAMISYEFVQLLLPPLRFDTQDLIFTLVGGVFTWFIQGVLGKTH